MYIDVLILHRVTLMSKSRLLKLLILRNSGKQSHTNSEKKVIVILCILLTTTSPTSISSYIFQPGFTLRASPLRVEVAESKWKFQRRPARLPSSCRRPLFPACCTTRCVDFAMAALLGCALVAVWERVLVPLAHPARQFPALSFL